VIAGVIAGLFAAAPAEDPASPVAIAPLTVAGDVEPGWTPALEAAMRDGLARAGVPFHVLDAVGSPCDGACWAAVADAAQLDMLILVRVTEHERLYEIEIEARDTKTDAVVLTSKQPCEPCGRTEVVEQLERQAAALGESLLRLDRSPATLAVDSQPTGAQVLLDGVRVGTTPMELRVPSGAHRVEVRLAGREARARSFTATPGVRERWQVTLGALVLDTPPAAPPPAARREPLWPAGWALAGVGLPVLAAGATFLAVHHRPYRPRCTGADFDADTGLCRNRWTSLPQGAALTAVGGAMLVSGIAMIAIGHRRRARSRAHSASLAPTFGGTIGAGAVIIGRF
jgi:hypothetical protein